MADHADESRLSHVPMLVKMSNSGFGVKSRESDIRRLGVFNRNGEHMGTVEDLYIDPEECKVRFLDVAAGGIILGLGEKRFLVPVEAVARIYEDGITVGQHPEKVSESPLFGTKVVPQAAYGDV